MTEVPNDMIPDGPRRLGDEFGVNPGIARDIEKAEPCSKCGEHNAENRHLLNSEKWYCTEHTPEGPGKEVEVPGIDTDIDAVESCCICGSKEPENQYWQDRDKWFCWFHSPNMGYAMEEVLDD